MEIPVLQGEKHVKSRKITVREHKYTNEYHISKLYIKLFF